MSLHHDVDSVPGSKVSFRLAFGGVHSRLRSPAAPGAVRRGRGRHPTRARSGQPAAAAVPELGSSATPKFYVPPGAPVNDTNRVIWPRPHRGFASAASRFALRARAGSSAGVLNAGSPCGPGCAADRLGGGRRLTIPRNSRRNGPVTDAPQSVAAENLGSSLADPAPGTAGAASSPAGATKGPLPFPRPNG